MRSPLLVATLTLSMAAAAACGRPLSHDPELILTGGLIYPLGATEEPVEALAIRGDRILAIGDDEEVLALAGDYTQQMELEGSVVLPGAYDAWLDPEALGRWSASALDLRLAASVEEAQAMVRNVAAGRPASDWVVGWGWSENDWPVPELPARRDLDATGSEASIVLLRRSGDIAWLNSAALQRIDVAAAAARPGGRVVEGVDGTPSGILIGAALDVLDEILRPPDAQRRREWIAAGLREAAAAGITRVATSALDAETVETLLDLEFRGLLPVRVDVRVTPVAAAEVSDGALAVRIADSALVRVVGVGVRMDGTLGARSAALLDPYGGGVTGDGVLRASGTEVTRLAALAADEGLPLHLHAAGDRAVDTALGAFDGELPSGTQLVGFDLPAAESLAQLGGVTGIAIAAARFADDIYWLDRILGSERAQRAHAWADLATTGVPLSFASDAPAYPLRPLLAVAAAVDRQDAEGYPADGWNFEQRLALPVAISALVGIGTIPDPTLRTDGPADLVVWSEDPLQGGRQALLRGQALLTIVAGRVAYSRPLVELPMQSERSR